MKHYGSKKVVCVALAFFILLSMWGGIYSASAKGTKCNIVLITIDALRADHLSCYGYERTTSPTIDSIAKGGIVCRNVYSPSSWTAPSMASLFTSVYPVNHGVFHGIKYVEDVAKNTQEVFSPDLTTLAEVLRVHGYSTFGVAANTHLAEKFGFGRGFDYFSCIPFEPAQAVNEVVYAWEDEIKKAQKFFLWIHYIDPHYPYTAQEPWIDVYASQKETKELLNLSPQSWWQLKTQVQNDKDPKLLDHLIALYDSEINYVDAHIGKLIERLNLYDNTLIIITSDHGEEFLEHGETGHGHNLYQQTIHIPFIVKLPERMKSTVLHQPLSLIDVMPTILEIAGLDAPEAVLGRPFRKKHSIFSWLKEKIVGADKANYIYAELDTKATLKTILAPPWKYIYNCGDKSDQLYNLISDPLELNNRAGGEPGELNQLKNQLFRWVETAKRYPTSTYDIELCPEEKEKLKGLGYLE